MQRNAVVCRVPPFSLQSAGSCHVPPGLPPEGPGAAAGEGDLLLCAAGAAGPGPGRSQAAWGLDGWGQGTAGPAAEGEARGGGNLGNNTAGKQTAQEAGIPIGEQVGHQVSRCALCLQLSRRKCFL